MSDSWWSVVKEGAPLLMIGAVCAIGMILDWVRELPSRWQGRGRYKRVKLLSDREQGFYRALRRALNDEKRIHVKVGLECLVSPLYERDWLGPARYLDRNVVDFVLCDNLQKVSSVVQLDNNSSLIAKALSSAGIPLHDFPAEKPPRVAELRERLFGPEHWKTRWFAVEAQFGLDARECMELGESLRNIRAVVIVSNEEGLEASAREIMDLMCLAVERGHWITVKATGEGAERALERIAKLDWLREIPKSEL